LRKDEIKGVFVFEQTELPFPKLKDLESEAFVVQKIRHLPL